MWKQHHEQGQQHVYASACGAEVCVCVMVCAEDNAMESVDSDEGSSNAPKHKPAPQKKRGVQKQQKRCPGRPRKHPSPSDPDKKKALQPRGGVTKASACSKLPFAKHTPSPLLPSCSLFPTFCFPIPLCCFFSIPLFCFLSMCTVQRKQKLALQFTLAYSKLHLLLFGTLTGKST